MPFKRQITWIADNSEIPEERDFAQEKTIPNTKDIIICATRRIHSQVNIHNFSQDVAPKKQVTKS